MGCIDLLVTPSPKTKMEPERRLLKRTIVHKELLFRLHLVWASVAVRTLTSF